MLKVEIESIYLSSVNKLKDILNIHKENQGQFSLTLDAWTADNQDAYLGITMLV